jgi:hypothetical protein
MTAQRSFQGQEIKCKAGKCPYQKDCHVPTEILVKLPPGFCCYIEKNCFFVQADIMLQDLLVDEESLGDLILTKREKNQERIEYLINIFISRYQMAT